MPRPGSLPDTVVAVEHRGVLKQGRVDAEGRGEQLLDTGAEMQRLGRVDVGREEPLKRASL